MASIITVGLKAAIALLVNKERQQQGWNKETWQIRKIKDIKPQLVQRGNGKGISCYSRTPSVSGHQTAVPAIYHLQH